jgi:hypothetical protein
MVHFFLQCYFKDKFKPLNAIYLKLCLLGHAKGGFLASKLVVCPPFGFDSVEPAVLISQFSGLLQSLLVFLVVSS